MNIDQQNRVDNLREKLPLSAVLRHYGIELKTVEEPCQISCPVHGEDRHPSARYYPDTQTFYCWTCQRAMDIVSLTMSQEGLGFWRAVKYLETVFGIKRPKPQGSSELIRRLKNKSKKAVSKRDVQLKVQDLEDILFKNRKELGLKKYLKALQALDIVISRIDDVSAEKNMEHIQKYMVFLKDSL